jgi:hypothetical protein
MCALPALALLWPWAFSALARALTSDPPGHHEIALRPYGVSWEANNPNLLFSGDGRQLCIWWEFGDVKPEYPAKFQVFDLGGRRLGGWNNTNFQGALRPFPGLAWRWQRADFLRPPPGRLVGGFAFNDDLSQGVRISFPNRQSADEHPDQPFAESVEMWSFTGRTQLLWSVELPPRGWFSAGSAKPIGILHDWRAEPLLVKLNGQWCAELDPTSGRTTRKFTFGRIESDDEARRRVKRFGGPEDAWGDFSAICCAYEPNHSWIACGSARDRRVRVISTLAPEKLLLEVHANDNPFRPLGGNWSASAEFFAGGRYLVAEAEFERRFGPYKHEVEVYDTSSWDLVWETKDNKTESFVLSPDGKTMAYIRKDTLVIAPFQPIEFKKARGR